MMLKIIDIIQNADTTQTVYGTCNNGIQSD